MACSVPGETLAFVGAALVAETKLPSNIKYSFVNCDNQPPPFADHSEYLKSYWLIFLFLLDLD
jgi:hypothetical protein